jgi:DNA-binding response OmpR family regulator
VRERPLILIVDDNPANLDIFETRMASYGYDIVTARDGIEGLNLAKEHEPDLILLDIMMPKMDGIEVCKRLRADTSVPFIPIILITAKTEAADIVAGLEAGGDEYLTKPVDHRALTARVKSMLRIKELHDRTQEQAIELAALNKNLARQVDEQGDELDRVGQLKRFFSPHLAEMIVSSGSEDMLKSHRSNITVVFCDLRGFTGFSETAEHEDIMRVLREFHETVGPLISEFEGTLEHFAGDGLMIIFNDPVPIPDPEARAIRMADAMRDMMGNLISRWEKRDHNLGFGVGIANGYATLGQIGFEGRYHYGAIGSVLNLASRLCDHAKAGQILITNRIYAEVEPLVEVEDIGALDLKGFHKPISTLNLVSVTEETE